MLSTACCFPPPIFVCTHVVVTKLAASFPVTPSDPTAFPRPTAPDPAVRHDAGGEGVQPVDHQRSDGNRLQRDRRVAQASLEPFPAAARDYFYHPPFRSASPPRSVVSILIPAFERQIEKTSMRPARVPFHPRLCLSLTRKHPRALFVSWPPRLRPVSGSPRLPLRRTNATAIPCRRPAPRSWWTTCLQTCLPKRSLPSSPRCVKSFPPLPPWDVVFFPAKYVRSRRIFAV